MANRGEVMNKLSTEQLGRLLILMRDTKITKNFVETNLIEGNEDIWSIISNEWQKRIDQDE